MTNPIGKSLPEKRNNKIKGGVSGLWYIPLVFFLLTCLYPVFWIIINSFKTTSDLFLNPWSIPLKPTLVNYHKAIVEYGMPDYFINSILISFGSVFFTVLFSMMAGFGVTRLRWKWNTRVLHLFILGLMIPAYGCIIPMYSLFMHMSLLDSRWAVIIAQVTFGLPTAILILSGFFVTIPSELEEAAVMDGCDAARIFLLVDGPIVAPGLVTVSIITFVNAWNDLLYSQLFLTSDSRMPITVGLLNFSGIHGTDYAGMTSAVVITVIPVIIVYVFLHKYIIEGMVTGAVKG